MYVPRSLALFHLPLTLGTRGNARVHVPSTALPRSSHLEDGLFKDKRAYAALMNAAERLVNSALPTRTVHLPGKPRDQGKQPINCNNYGESKTQSHSRVPLGPVSHCI